MRAEWFARHLAPLRNYEAEAATYRSAICQHGRDGRLALELGVGTGEISKRLLRTVPTILGVDSDPDMVGFIRSRRRRGLLPILADAGALPLREGSVDIAYAPFGFIANFADEHLLATLLRGVHRVMKPGGLLLLNGFHAGRLGEIYPAQAWHPYRPNGTTGPPVARVRVALRPGSDAVTLWFDLDGENISFDLRGWAPRDVGAVAAACGFRVRAVMDSTSSIPYGEKSEEYVVVAHKVAA